MAHKKTYKNKKDKNGNFLTPEQYRAIQLEIDNLQIFRSALGVAKSKKCDIIKKSKKKSTRRSRIYELERYARE